MRSETYESVWDAICDSREEAANLQLRSTLMSAIREKVKSWTVTEAEAAKRLAITRPRLNDLMRGKLNKFSLDALVNIAATAGFMPSLHLDLRTTDEASGMTPARKTEPFESRGIRRN